MSSIAAKLAERDLSGCRALVIDGDQTARSVMISQLRDFGVGDVAHFGRVRDARKFLESKSADFVLCEQSFHGDGECSGQDLLDDLRRSQLLPYSSVFIIVTGEATYAKVAEAAESSLDGYLLKPHKPSMLYERLMQARRRKIALKSVFDPIEAEDYLGAARACQRVYVQKLPYRLFAARLGADLYLSLGLHEEAKRLFEAVLAENELAWARLGVARATLDAGKIGAAIGLLDSMLAADPKMVDAYDVLGRAHVESGNFARAIEIYRKATELTPGSISRVQKHGIISFYLGDHKTALRALSRCALLGSDSKMFDYQSYVLLAFCALFTKDRKLLARCLEDLGKTVERQPGSVRLRRFRAVVSVLNQLLTNRQDEALAALRDLATELPGVDFDFESACNLALLTSQVRAMDCPLPEAEAWIRAIGLRYCRARALTEQLVNSTQLHAPFQELVRACQSEVNDLAQRSMKLSLDGKHQAAVEQLVAQGRETMNAKLIENAFMLLQRYASTVPRAEALQQEVAALRDTYGVNHSRDVIGRDTVRRTSSTTLKTIAQSSLDEGDDQAVPAFAD